MSEVLECSLAKPPYDKKSDTGSSNKKGGMLQSQPPRGGYGYPALGIAQPMMYGRPHNLLQCIFSFLSSMHIKLWPRDNGKLAFNMYIGSCLEACCCRELTLGLLYGSIPTTGYCWYLGLFYNPLWVAGIQRCRKACLPEYFGSCIEAGCCRELTLGLLCGSILTTGYCWYLGLFYNPFVGDWHLGGAGRRASPKI